MKQLVKKPIQQEIQKSNSQIITHILPNVICKLLYNATILINLWWSRSHQILLMGMGVATVFSFTFGYLIIISLNTGLAYEISRKKNKPQKIGIFYQRALIINFLICFITITPLLYISKRCIFLFTHIDSQTSVIIGQYLFQLLPSIYCFAYFDTTQTFLQSQGHILAPLLIQIVSVFMHMYLINMIDAAWSKNWTDIFCCIAIYAYIVMLDKPLDSWVEWTIKCVKGWGTHLKFLQIIGLSTYLESLFFFFFSVSAFRIDQQGLICHICFVNIMQIIYLALLGIKVGGLSKIGFRIKQNDLQNTRKQSEETIKIILGTGIIFIFIILIYRSQIVQFFIYQDSSREVFRDNYWMLILTIGLTSIQAAISSLIKALQKNFSVLKLNILSYIVGIFIANILCYYYGYGMSGMWLGWNFGVLFNFCFCFYHLYRRYKDIFFQKKNCSTNKFSNLNQIHNNKKDLQNDQHENNRSFQMKNLNSNLKNLSKSPIFQKQSLAVISEADSAMQGSKALLIDKK